MIVERNSNNKDIQTSMDYEGKYDPIKEKYDPVRKQHKLTHSLNLH